MRKRLAPIAIVLMLSHGCSSGPMITAPSDKTESIGHYAIPQAMLELTIELKYPKAALTDAMALRTGAVSMTVKTVQTVLVPAAHIPLHYAPSSFSSDKVTLDVNEKGFLTQVAVDVDDKSAEFIDKIVDIAGAAVKITDLHPATVYTLDSDSGEITQEIRHLLNPYSDHDEIDVIENIGGNEIQIDLSTQGVSDISRRVPNQDQIEKRCANKICYPGLVARSINFTGPAGTTDTKLVVIPDLRYLFEIDLVRAAAVKKVVTADFADGMLTKLVLDKPSQALAIAEIPFNVLSAIVAIPAEIVQLKIDTSSQNKDLLDAQKDLIEAQQSLLEAVQKAKSENATDDGLSGFTGD